MKRASFAKLRDEARVKKTRVQKLLASGVKRRMVAGGITENRRRTGLRAKINIWKSLIRERKRPLFGDIVKNDTAAKFKTSK